MADRAKRAAFEAAVAAGPDLAQLRADAVRAHGGDPQARLTLAAAFTHAAFVDPFAVLPVYDAFCGGWLDMTFDDAGFDDAVRGGDAPPDAFWRDFWAHFDARREGRIGAGEVTARVAGLGSALPIEHRARWEAAAVAHPKGANAAQRAMPPKLTLGELARHPKGSLAAEFHALVTGNAFDLEVLDRDALGLATLPPALRYHNTRILQMHDVWHLVGGFHFTALHEIAVSAFQLAQFSHGYSAMFLASAVTGLAFDSPDAASPVLQTIAEAWAHGRSMPSFMAIAWEDEWALSLEALRARHGIVPFAGSLPPDLFEMGRAA